VRSFRTQAILLRSVDYGESDRILHLLVPESGRLTAIAKGARRSMKRFGGTLDFFNQLQVQVERRREGAMARLDQAVLLRAFAPLRAEPRRFALACYLLELLDRLAPEGGARADTQRLFAFALRALAAVAERDPGARLRIFLELHLLDLLGLRPELARCVRCGAEVSGAPLVGFHVADGGPQCAACGLRSPGLLEVHVGTLRALELLLRLDEERLGRLVLPAAALEEARVLLERFQRFHLGVELRSEAFLDALLAQPASGACAYTAAPLAPLPERKAIRS
jgi:DNA repair protein RecO (recombination protein O)